MAVDLRIATQHAEARVGSVIKDKWRLDKLIGVGGMASVYAATHRNKKRAAVKMLHPQLSVDPALRERFLREGYVANTVEHRGAVTVHDDDVAEDGSAYIVMELLEGETLEQRWRRKGERLPVSEVLAVADQVLEVLDAAHRRGVVHRDLKPENLFLTREGAVKLLDFGIARMKELGSTTITTQSGATMGTPAFMAPEQARGRWEEVDGRTDLWALGATIFTLLTGEHVHDAETVNETLALAVTRPARSLALLRPDLPQSVISLVDRALEYAKTERFPDASVMQQAVRYAYGEVSGHGGMRPAAFSLPDLESTPEPFGFDARSLPTEVRGGASDHPTVVRPRRRPTRPVLIALAASAALGLVLIVLAAARRAPDESGRPSFAAAVEARPEPPAARTVAAPQPPAPSRSHAEEAPEAPHVSIDALPRERVKATGSDTRRIAPAPAKASAAAQGEPDPFARRR